MQVESRSYSDSATIGPIRRALILKTFPGFASLKTGELAVMASVCEERFFPAGATMHEPGAPVQALHLVVEGSVDILRRGRVIQTLGPKSSIGGLAALTRDPQGTHAVCVEDTLALAVDVDDMQDIFEDHFSIALGVLGALSHALREFQMLAGGAAVTSHRYFEPVTHDRPLHLVEKMFFLRKTTNFAHASIEALAALATHAIEKRYSEGTELWTIGGHSDSSLLVMSGGIRGFPESGKPFDFPVGFVVGGIDSLSRSPRWYRAEAAGELRALEMPRNAVLDTLEDHPDMTLLLMRALATGIDAALERAAAQQEQASKRKSAPPPESSESDA